MPGQRCESGGESGNAREGEGASRDAERAAEELGDPLPGLPSPHHDAWRCVPGVRGGDAAHHPGRGGHFSRWSTGINSAKIIHSYLINLSSLYYLIQLINSGDFGETDP